MTGNILVMKGLSRYNVLRLAADEMIDAFMQLGYNVTEADFSSNDDINETFHTVFQQNYDLIFSFQALYFELRLNDGTSSLLNAFGSPVFGHIVDHPIYHRGRLEKQQGENIHICCIDRNHVSYTHQFYPHIQNVEYLPHGGFSPTNNLPFSERTIDVYFPCSYSSPETAYKSIEALPEVYRNMAKTFVKQMLSNSLLTLQTALSDYLQIVNFSCSSEEFTQMMNILYVVDLYIRSYTREQCIRALLDNNIKLTVSGNGWDKFESSSEHTITILTTEGLDISETLSIMGNSKMVLNHIPTLQNGMHERIFSTMRCGSICLTNDFPIVHEEFTDGENIVLYSNDKLQTFTDKVSYLLEHPFEAQSIAEKGNQIANASHTWFHNAQKILEFAGLSLGPYLLS